MKLPGRRKVDDPSESEAKALLDLVREERQVIVPVEAARTLAIDIAAEEQGKDSSRVFGARLLGALGASAASGAGLAAVTLTSAGAGGVTGAAVTSPTAVTGPVGPAAGFFIGAVVAGGAGAVAFRRYLKRARSKKLPANVVFVYMPVARHLRFWRNLEPEPNTAYCCHPMKDEYIPENLVDPALLSDKVREAQDLLVVLGASRIEVSQDSSGAISLSAALDGIPGVAGGLGASGQRVQTSYQVLEFEGSPLPTLDPSTDSERFAWYVGEPTWQDLYRHRLESKLKATKFELVYSADYGIDADLRASLEELGIALGPVGKAGARIAKLIAADLKLKASGTLKADRTTKVSWEVKFPT